MEIKYPKLTRWNINTLCDAIPVCPSLDMKHASKTATHMVRETLRKQLIDISIAQTNGTIEKVKERIINDLLRARIKNDEFIGLRSPEALTVFLSQLSLDAFKAVGDEKDAANVINTLKGIFQTVQNRDHPITTVHFDLEYSPVPGYSFTYREAIDTKIYFVYTTLRDYVLPDGYTVGVMERYKGDGVNKTIARQREDVVGTQYAPLIAPGPWTKLYNLIHGTDDTKASIFVARIRLDTEAMYANEITMQDLVDILDESTRGIQDISLTYIPSSFSEGIIDVHPRSKIEDDASEVDEVLTAMHQENDLLYNVLRRAIEDIRVSGIPYDVSTKNFIPKVLDLKVVSVKYNTLYQISKVTNTYPIEEIGRRLWSKELNVTNWKDIEYSCYVDKKGKIFYSDDESETEGMKRATESQLNDLFIGEFLGENSLKDLWVLTLNVTKMILAGVEYENIEKMLDYCGLKVLHVEQHPFLDNPGSVYLISKENPKDVIDRHFAASRFNYTDIFENNLLSQSAKEWIKDRAGEDDLVEFLKTPEKLELERIDRYTYVILETSKKHASGQLLHVANHTYDQVTRFPWVDRRKTISNDWYNVTLVLGVDIARNNYLIDPYREMVKHGAKIDPRHLTLFASYVFEKGYPAGASLGGVVAHGIDFLTESFIERADTQLLKGYTRKPASNLSMYLLTGGIATRGILELKEREVAMRERMSAVDRMRARLMFSKQYHRESITNSVAKTPAGIDLSAMILAIRSKMISGDPFAGIPMLSSKEKIKIKYPDELILSEDLYGYNDGLIKYMKKETMNTLQKVRLMKKYVVEERRIIVVKASVKVYDVEDIYLKIKGFNGKLF